MNWEIREGDCLTELAKLEPASIQTCVTSPPYWGLRDYGTATWEGGDPGCEHRVGGQVEDNKAGGAIVAGVRPGVDASVCLNCGAKRIDSQLGLEPTPEEYVENLVAVFREVRRVLRDDGTVWLNLGDSYAGSGKGPSNNKDRPELHMDGISPVKRNGQQFAAGQAPTEWLPVPKGIKAKDLVGIPWRVAFALQADGWWLRSDIIWAKPNPMPESVTDRPTRSHEYIFLLTKSARYFYDADAVRESGKDWSKGGPGTGIAETQHYGAGNGGNGGLSDLASRYKDGEQPAGRNRRSVWTVTTQPYSDAHFATFPPKLIEPCVLAGSPPKCCGECGAAWERIVEAKASSEGRENWAGQEASKNGASRKGGFYDAERTTTGWRSTCDHDDDSGSATVLDPFAGAGTTGLVATQQGRDFIGIELNPEYAEMARERIKRWEANPNGHLSKAEQLEGQSSIFDHLG